MGGYSSREQVLHTQRMTFRAMTGQSQNLPRKARLNAIAYAGIGKGMSPSYVWVARGTCQRSRFPSAFC